MLCMLRGMALNVEFRSFRRVDSSRRLGTTLDQLPRSKKASVRPLPRKAQEASIMSISCPGPWHLEPSRRAS